ncbi:LysR family transcriptional regulator [Aliidongia dinghuensis]|uniref:LysR family transcriptional regulator n=1 Tax=Aliidongia dinghuensis TaxID=1867774 RepID=A0A8J2YS52_9PROT|nr:LysR substrate-binding domain-containing protein [Aliidongia dinghuensis]GGF12343.1 LysR family transcriptional regulator [Aliidongia dinghuensis]
MVARINLDMDILRTLVTAEQLGGFNRAADRIGRSQSAVSQQIRRLEEQVGETLYRKSGRGLAMTEAGDVMLAYARRMLELNDEAVAAVRGVAVDGAVRFGLPSDLAETWLSTTLGRFKRAHPAVLIEAVVDRNAVLLDDLDKGRLDLALVFGGEARSDAQHLATLPMRWIGPAKGEPIYAPGEALPLVMYGPPCFFRQAGIDALDRAGMPWRTAFTSTSLHGLWAAVDAGLGVTLRTAAGLPDSLVVLGEQAGLPAVPTIALCLHDAGRPLSPAAGRLKEILLDTLVQNLPGLTP